MQVGQGDEAILRALLKKFPGDINRCLHACRRIRDGIVTASSIDDFIDTHKHDEDIALCGKLAIARAILESEGSSTLFYEKRNTTDTIDFPKLNETWYPGFYRVLREGVAKTDLESLFDNVTLITFNYDRCIEQYLSHAIASTYQIPFEQAKELVSTLTIYRPYGSVGSYFGPQAVQFGSSQLPTVDMVAKNLRTYTEQVHDDESLNAMRAAISGAEALVFLGTAFHKYNMTLLTGQPSKTPKTFYYTRDGTSDAALNVVCERLNRLTTSPGQHHRVKKCYELFGEFRILLQR